MKLLTAKLTKPARQVETKYGTCTVADAIDQNGNEQTIWRPANDPVLTALSVNSPVTLAVDSKGKISLVDNQETTARHVNPEPNQSQYQGMSNETKKQVASYITEMSNLFNFCLKQVDQTIENITPDDRRAIATTLFVSAQKKYSL